MLVALSYVKIIHVFVRTLLVKMAYQYVTSNYYIYLILIILFYMMINWLKDMKQYQIYKYNLPHVSA